MNKQVLVVGVGAGVVGAALGSTATYFITRKRIKAAVFAEADREIERQVQSVKDTWALLRKEPPYDNPVSAAKAYLDRMDHLDSLVRDGIQVAEGAAEDLVQEAEEAIVEAQEELQERIEDADEIAEAADVAEDIIDNNGYGGLPDERKTQVHNIFDVARQRAEVAEAYSRSDDEGESFDELANREARPPHVISYDDYFDDSNDFTKITISYFEGDDTLADDHEQIIPNIERAVGQANMLKFGQDSDDKNTVYIRNEALRVDYEVTREEGSFSEVVLGIRDMEQSRDRRIKKMRNDE